MTRKPHKTPPAQPYQYNELPRNGFFRYLILQPGTGDDPLECSLQTALLSVTTFEAISYVWGSSVKDKGITCDGCSISITTNLSNVLRRLRLADSTRTLWADGICINQDDLEEKGHQVAIMGDIYRSAKCVLIYIGSEDNGHGPLVCSLLDDVNRMIDETCKHIDMSWDSFPYSQNDNSFLSDCRWSSLLNLFRQSWFARGWVVREAAFAQYGLVIWHKSEFGWEKLMRSYMWLIRRGIRAYYDFDFDSVSVVSHSHAFTQKEKAFVKPFYPTDDSPTKSLLSQIHAAKSLHLSDARDRIYAFMELSDGTEHMITTNPDYHLAPLEVYCRFAVQYIQEKKDIQILEHVCHESNWESIDMPSWIPRWDMCIWSIAAATQTQWQPTTARDRSVGEPKIINPRILFVRGVILDSVLHVSDVFKAHDIGWGTVDELWNTISHMLNTSPYGASTSLNAFLDSLSHGGFLGNRKDWLRSRASLMARVNAKHDLLASGELAHQRDLSDKFDAPISVFLDFVKSRMVGNRFIITRRGYMGLTPHVTQKDDACGIIFGCQTPCILRQTARKQHYKYIGATGLMGARPFEADGEIVFTYPLGQGKSKEWVKWDVEEQDVYLV